MGSYVYKVLLLFKRKFKIKEVEPPLDVKEAFARYSESDAHLSADQLRQFLVEFQGEEGCTLSVAEQIVEQVLHRRHHLAHYKGQGRLTLDDFFHYLFSDDLNGPIKSQVHHDMNAPLSHYFIYTGHNSYLRGNQVTSESSDVPIIKALQRGVRVIELDLWPNSTKDDIKVVHGRTFTTPVPLIQCLKSIKDYAFVTSPYPVILTLEDHLTPALQTKVAEMVTQTFGDNLYYPDSEGIEEFPSPEALKHQILLSTKPPKDCLESKNMKENGNVPSKGSDSLEEEASGKDMLDSVAELEAHNDTSNGDQDDKDGDVCDCKSRKLIAPEYKSLIAMHTGKRKGGLKETLKVVADKVKRISLSEEALKEAAVAHGTDVVRFTQKNVLRVYPKGIRVGSTNYNPLVGWMHGAQMVAFNMQGHGKHLRLMHGMFRSNGGCGYVKKPDFLLSPHNEVFDPKRTLPVKTTLKVRVYMGDGWRLDFSPTHFDSYSPPDFYTKVYIVGVPADATKNRTKIKKDNWVPVWDEEFVFPLTVPELALLRIEVTEHDITDTDDFGGQTCFPVSELRPGIRAVPLFNKKGDKYKSVKLLMRFQFV
ncbi:hypothetical protein L1049_011000 [Liquidambar formosana]|uniref:Phosphoinositide phospholipase C n=1 Tax=Liquidambar formosana TaxID=63359 RepID=A0AAP0RQZ0_LIQFO